jgi:hypothetical protein
VRAGNKRKMNVVVVVQGSDLIILFINPSSDTIHTQRAISPNVGSLEIELVGGDLPQISMRVADGCTSATRLK